MISDVFLYLMCFSIFVVLQSLALNGLFECFKGASIKKDNGEHDYYDGMIIYMMAPKFFEDNRKKFWAKTYTCIKCISGWAGTLSFWVIVYPVFGFKWVEVIVNGFDILILISLNQYFYKKL